MVRGAEDNPDVPFALSIRGLVPAEHAEAFYAHMLFLLQNIGRTSTANQVEISFNVPALDLGYSNKLALEGQANPVPTEMSPEQLAELVKAFGEYVRSARVAAHVSQARVAAEAGISQSYLSQIELAKSGANGPLRPLPNAVFGLARALNLDPADLLARAGYSQAEQDQQ